MERLQHSELKKSKLAIENARRMDRDGDSSRRSRQHDDDDLDREQELSGRDLLNYHLAKMKEDNELEEAKTVNRGPSHLSGRVGYEERAERNISSQLV